MSTFKTCSIRSTNFFRRFFCLAVVLTLSAPGILSAAESYPLTYITSGGKAIITGCDTAYSGALTIPSYLGGYPVTSIGDEAFEYCDDLTSVTIPDGVTTIGDYAFYSCDGLTSVSIPGSVISIGSFAFYYCYNLTGIEIPYSVTSIGVGAFRYCYDMTAINVNAGNPNYASEGGVLFNKSMTTLIQYPSRKVGASYTVPSTVTVIGDYAFHNCNYLTGVTIPNSVTSIGIDAFYFCSNLTGIEIPASVTSIGDSAFRYCYDMTAITVDAGNPNYAGEGGVLFNKSMTTLIQFPMGKPVRTYTVPSLVTAIGDYAFHNCDDLTDVTIPGSVKSIGYYAFYSCDGLIDVTIPESVKSIGDYAFYSCDDLTEVTIHESVTFIGYSAFRYCNNLSKAVFLGNAPSMGSYVFQSTAADFAIYFNWKATGFTTPTWKGYPTISSLLTFYVNGGEAIITDCDQTYSGTLEIPGTLGVYPVTSIEDSAFHSCGSLTGVTIPSSVISIADLAFNNCSSLTGITIPSSVTFIGNNAFGNCNNMTAITVDGGNPNYASADGVLFNKNKTILIQYPCGKSGEYTIPSGVTTIREDAFENCGSLTRITLPASITSIGNYAFYSCNNLTEAMFLGNAPAMGISVFSSVAPGFAVHFYHGATGFTTPTWQGYPAGAVSEESTPISLEITLAGNAAGLRCCSTESGRRYRLQHSATMEEGSWVNVGTAFDGNGADQLQDISLDSLSGSGFFRLVLEEDSP